MDKELLDRLTAPCTEASTASGCGCAGTEERVADGRETDCCRAAECERCSGFEGCAESRFGLVNEPLAMVYAPCQAFRALYDPATALSRGTMFCELDLPFGCPSGASCLIEPRA